MATKKGAGTRPVKSVAGSKARLGVITIDVLRTGIARLSESQGDLRAMLNTMEASGLTEIEIDGPKLLPRGVNSIMSFRAKLMLALSSRDKM